MAPGGHGGPGLQKGLSQRHLTTIAIGGVIGAGLSTGSGEFIRTTGPGAFLTCALTGVLVVVVVVVVVVVRVLGETATADPGTGSSGDCARAAPGEWAGSSTAWLHWCSWVIVVGSEAARERGGASDPRCMMSS